MKDLVEILKSRGIKVTPQRLAIYKFLVGSKAHPSVETVYNHLKPDFPGMSLNTVYNTVQLLESQGLIQKLYISDRSTRYDGNPEPHIHLVCLYCQRVFDLDDSMNDLVSDLAKRLKTDSGFILAAEKINLYGYCDTCRKNKFSREEKP